MRIEESYFSYLTNRYSQLPRERFVTYCRDLYALHEEELSFQSLLLGSQYSYAMLGDAVLEQCAKKNSLENIDLVIAAIWSPEFDPEYASWTAYFACKYKIQGQVIDVSDQGSLIPFTALNLLQKYLQENQYKKALFLYLEQTTIPRNKNSKVVLPVYDASMAMILHGITPKEKSHEVVAAGILNESQNAFVLRVAQEIVGVGQSLTVITKYPEMLQANRLYQIKKIPCVPGPVPWLYAIHHIVCACFAIHFGLILDQDAETDEVGYLIIRSDSCSS